MKAVTPVARAVQSAKTILAVIPVEAAILAKVVQLGKIPLVALEAATLVVKATHLAKTILAAILVEAATLVAKAIQLAKMILVAISVETAKNVLMHSQE